jgi:hypothetical protein
VPFCEENLCPAYQIVKGRHGEKVRRSLFKFSFDGRTADRAFPVMVRVPATAAAPVLPVNPAGPALEDRDRLDPEDQGNILDCEVIGIQASPEIQCQGEKVAIRTG